MSQSIDPLTARQMANAARRQLDVTAARLRDQLGPDEMVHRLSSAAARRSQQFAAGVASKAVTSKPAILIAFIIGIAFGLKHWGIRTRARAARLNRRGDDE